jgi:hypothetical protein
MDLIIQLVFTLVKIAVVKSRRNKKKNAYEIKTLSGEPSAQNDDEVSQSEPPRTVCRF